VKIAVASDMDTTVARAIVEELKARGHEPESFGALAESERSDWAWSCERGAREVAQGAAEQGIVCCWSGTGASIAANKVTGIRAALCTDAVTARAARQYNDANVLAISLRITSEDLMREILDAWFATEPSEDAKDRANIEHITAIDSGGE